MKQIKNLALIAIAVVAGLSFTSCLGDSKDDKATQSVLGILRSDGTFEQYGGQILVPNQAIAYPEGMYMFNIEYNPNDLKDNKLPVKITSSELDRVENTNILPIESKGNIPMYSLDYQNQMKPYIFNKDYIVIPAMFWAKDVTTQTAQEEEVNKHSFSLCCPVIEEGSEVLELTIVDDVKDSDIERNKYTYKFQAFNIRNLISQFKAKNASLKTIRIKAYVNDETPDMASDKTKLATCDLDYSLIDKNIK